MFLRSLKFKIVALFSGVFIISSAVLFTVFYLFQYNALVQEDRRSLEARTLEFWAIYQTGGAVGIQRALNIETFLTDYDPFLLRIASRTNQTLALYYPSTWKEYRISDLERVNPQRADNYIRISQKEGNAFLEVTSVVLSDGNVLQIAMSSARRQSLLQRFRAIYLLSLIPIVALSVTGGFVFSGRTLKPIHRLIDLTKSIIETGRMSERLPTRGSGDELDELTGLFNKMLVRIETLIEGMRRSLDNVAHDLRTPLTRLRQEIETAMQDAPESLPHSGALTDAIGESEQIQSMLSTLMDISEAETGVMNLNRKSINLSSVVEDLVDFYSYIGEEKDVTIHCGPLPIIEVSIDVDRFRQVVTNLLDNAVKYTPSGGSIEVSVSRTNGVAVLEVSDTGVGISEEDLPHIWERLFRGDRSRSERGLGLGLGLVKAIVEAHGGSVEVSSEAGRGSKFTVKLP